MEDKKLEEQELIPGTNIPRPRYREPYETDESYVEYLREYYSKYFPEVDKDQVANNQTFQFDLESPEKESEHSTVEAVEASDEQDEEKNAQESIDTNSIKEVVPESKDEQPIPEAVVSKDEQTDEEIKLDIDQVSERSSDEEVDNSTQANIEPEATLETSEEAKDLSSIQEGLESYADSLGNPESDTQQQVVDSNDNSTFEFDLEPEVENYENNEVNDTASLDSGNEIAVEYVSSSSMELNSRVKTVSLFQKVKTFFSNARNAATRVVENINDYYDRGNNIFDDDTSYDLDVNEPVVGRSR